MMKNPHAAGCWSVTGWMTLAQSSPVITWNIESRDVGRSPKFSGSVEENIWVLITPAT